MNALEKHLSTLPEIKSTSEKRVPEKSRLELRHIIRRITDIINNLRKRSRTQTEGDLDEYEDKKVILLSAALIEVLSEKRLEYENEGVEFISEFAAGSEFVFINIQLSAFSRSLSNLLNNAKQAFDGKPGKVILKLNIDEEYAHITIEDSGKGMSEAAVDKIKHNISFTEGKKSGHGIGLGQVHDMLSRNFGIINIESTLSQGSAITLSFPKHSKPLWSIDTMEPHTPRYHCYS